MRTVDMRACCTCMHHMGDKSCLCPGIDWLSTLHGLDQPYVNNLNEPLILYH